MEKTSYTAHLSMPTLRAQGAVPRDAGPTLHEVSVVPDSPRAVVGILHGYADHAVRYAHVMDAWADLGIASIALDMRGHGHADGPRGYCGRFEEYLSDAAALASLVAERVPEAPGFLYGHSFGGLVAAHSILESARAWKGVLLSGPYFGRGFHIPAPKRIAAQVASRLVPRLSLPAGIRGEHVSHDPVMAHRYDTDPLVFKNGNVRWFTESGRAQAEALARAGSFKLPLYVVYGAEDPLSRVASGKAFFDAAGSADKTFDERVGLRHEVVNEIEWKAVVATMAEWILRHAGASR